MRTGVCRGIVWWRRRRSPVGVAFRTTVTAAVCLLTIFTVCQVVVAQDDGQPARPPAGRFAGGGPGGPEGRWREVAEPDGAVSEGDLTPEQRRQLEQLNSIGYLGALREAVGLAGVTVHDRERAQHGLNFYSSGHQPGAVLADMEGNVLHTWSADFLDVWPDRGDLQSNTRTSHWRRAYLYENGDVLGIYEGVGMVKLDRDSNVIWKHLGGEHHDLEVMEDGRIFVLSRESRVVPEVSETSLVLEDFVTVLDEDGEVLSHQSILDAFWNSQYEQAVRALNFRTAGDITHTNTLHLLDGTLSNIIPAFREGNFLISFRKLDAIAVLDHDANEIVWLMAGPWLGQHQPELLPTGRILLFDNGGVGPCSRVVEFDPVTQRDAWSYGELPGQEFYTKSCGTAERLANGNTLITESDNGHVFEVTGSGEIVWEYWNPERAGDEGELIATIFEMLRLPADYADGWLR